MKKLDALNWESNKFIIISLIIHSLFFLQFKSVNTLGEVHFSNKISVPVSFNIVDLPQRIDNFKSVKGGVPQVKSKKKTNNTKEIQNIKKTAPIEKEKTIEKKLKKPYSKVKEKTEVIEKPREIIKEKVVPVENKQEIIKEKTEVPEKKERAVIKEENLKQEEKNKEAINENAQIKSTEKDTTKENKQTNVNKNIVEEIQDSKDFESKDGIENNEEQDEFLKSGNFTVDSNGTYTAVSAKGIHFEILHQIDPNYPRQAEMIRYKKEVTIKVRFLVNIDGNIENIEIIKSHKKFGFDKEVIKALKRWKFKPILHNEKQIKVYFNKEFVFAPKS